MAEQPMNDLWVLDTKPDNVSDWTWTQVPTTSSSCAEQTSPCPRSFHRMIAVGTDLFVFGGCGAQGRLNDLWKFSTTTQTWHALGASLHLRGRGGPNLVALDGQRRRIAVVGGFAGEETNDGHCFSLTDNAWERELMRGLSELRPRSVCCCVALTDGVVIFGGEVDPSAKGHEGAGGFENDIVVLDAATGDWMQTIRDATTTTTTGTAKWPAPRGWSACDASSNSCWIFGGLSGDDTDPVRLGDLWKLKLTRKDNN